MKIKQKMSKENSIKCRFATSSTNFTQMKTQDLKSTFLLRTEIKKVDTITTINECKKWLTTKDGAEKNS